MFQGVCYVNKWGINVERPGTLRIEQVTKIKTKLLTPLCPLCQEICTNVGHTMIL